MKWISGAAIAVGLVGVVVCAFGQNWSAAVWALAFTLAHVTILMMVRP